MAVAVNLAEYRPDRLRREEPFELERCILLFALYAPFLAYFPCWEGAGGEFAQCLVRVGFESLVTVEGASGPPRCAVFTRSRSAAVGSPSLTTSLKNIPMAYHISASASAYVYLCVYVCIYIYTYSIHIFVVAHMLTANTYTQNMSIYICICIHTDQPGYVFLCQCMDLSVYLARSLARSLSLSLSLSVSLSLSLSVFSLSLYLSIYPISSNQT